MGGWGFRLPIVGMMRWRAGRAVNRRVLPAALFQNQYTACAQAVGARGSVFRLPYLCARVQAAQNAGARVEAA